MIRDRREQDLARLCEVLGALDDRVGVLAGREPHDWLTEIDAECSWVFDQAPVSVAPTRNVVGHVQIHRARDVGWAREVATQHLRQVEDLLVIGRLFVKPVPHADNIARYLLRESVKYAEARGSLPALGPHDTAFVPESVTAALGFGEFRVAGEMERILVRVP